MGRPHSVNDKVVMMAAKSDPEILGQVLEDAAPLMWYWVYRLSNIIPPEAGMDDNDKFQEVSLSFLKALRNFDFSRENISFSSYFSRVATNDFGMKRRPYKARKRKPPGGIASLEDVVSVDGNGNVLTLADVVESNAPSPGEEYMMQEEYLWFLDMLAPLERDVLRLNTQGLTGHQIARRVGVSQPYVSRIIIKLRQRYVDMLAGKPTVKRRQGRPKKQVG